MSRPPPVLTHEAAAAMWGYLAAVAERYPWLCEREQGEYRDLARAALEAVRDSEICDGLHMAGEFDRAVNRLVAGQVRAEAGHRLIREMRAGGILIFWRDGQPWAKPARLLTPAVLDRLKARREDLREALADAAPWRTGEATNAG